jgi:hypothetical protein
VTLRLTPAAVQPRTRTGERSSSRRLPPLVVVFLIAAAISVAYLGAGLWATDTWRGNVGDPEQFMWFLSSVPHALFHGHNPLVSTYELYPQGTNLMWNTSVVLPGIAVSPVTMLAGPVFSYNLLLVLGPIATSCTAYWAFRRYVESPVAAGIGGLAFAFSPFLLVHGSGHLHLVLLALVPVMLVLVDELLVRQRRRSMLTGGLIGLVAACQLMTSEEVLAIEAMTAGLALVILCVLHPHAIRSRTGYVVRAAVCAVITFTLLAAYPLYIQLFGPQKAPAAHGPSTYSTDLLNLVWPVDQWFDLGAGSPPFTGNASEWTGYLGIPLIVLLLGVAVRFWRRRPLVPVAALLTAVLIVLSFGPHLHVDGRTTPIPLPWAVAERLPLLENLLPGRISMAIGLLAALLLAVFVDDLVGRRGWQKLAGAALVALIAVSWIPGGLRTTTIPTPKFFTTSAQTRIPDGSVALIVPYTNGPLNEQAVLWQANARMRFRIVNGWVIVPGPHWGGPNSISRALDDAQAVTVTPLLRASILADLHRLDVGTVIVGPSGERASDIALLTRVFGRPPTVTGGVGLWTVR